jgi:tRNA-2-methylthio-N6-dimethylallyladenosine synthase
MTAPRKLHIKSYGCQMKSSPAASRRPRAPRSSAAQPAVDLVVGPQAYHRLPAAGARAAAARRHRPAGRRQVRLPAGAEAGCDRARGISAFVTVQEGCDKFCAFCVVPYTRGAEFSRPVAQIMAEVERLAASGVQDVTLIGQNVNAYHGEGPDGRLGAGHADVSRRRSAGIARIRYTTSHPRDMDETLIAAHRDLPQADAVPASAGAGRFRPDSGGDEPQAYSRRVSPLIERIRRRGPTSLVLGFHRRLPRRERGRGFAGDGVTG